MDCLFTSLLLLTPFPELAERERFPCRDAAYEAIQTNRAYRRYCETMQKIELHRWWHWQEVIDETEQMYLAWDCLYAVQGGEGGDEEYWRASLLALKGRLDPKMYAQGDMPPPTPGWRMPLACYH